MKTIAIVTREMMSGGVERALLSMLSQCDFAKVKIDLFVESWGGELFDEVPIEVTKNLIPNLGNKNAYRHPVLTLKKVWWKLSSKKSGISKCEYNYRRSKVMLPLKQEYDIAISYHATDTLPMFYVIDKIKAKKKILWLHNQIHQRNANVHLLKLYYEKFDYVYAVSKSLRAEFLEICPDMCDKSDVFYNILDENAIREKSLVGPTYTDKFEGIRILTIGRIDYEKGYDLAIEACKRILNKGYNIRWYVCGEGAKEKEKLDAKIEKEGIQDSFVWLGNQTNPYGYLKNCDIYVQPSRSEGYSLTVHEARIMCKPIVSTRTQGPAEQIQNNMNGWLVDISSKAIEEQIEWCINNPEECKRVCMALEKENRNYDSILEKLWN